MRARRRKAERRWRETGLTIHRNIFNTERLRVNTLVQSQKGEYYALKIQEHACSQKGLFKVVDSLLQRKGHLSSLPQHSCPRHPANNFSKFFNNKISTIYQALSVIPVGSTQPSNDMTDMHTEEMASLAVPHTFTSGIPAKFAPTCHKLILRLWSMHSFHHAWISSTLCCIPFQICCCKHCKGSRTQQCAG